MARLISWSPPRTRGFTGILERLNQRVKVSSPYAGVYRFRSAPCPPRGRLLPVRGGLPAKHDSAYHERGRCLLPVRGGLPIYQSGMNSCPARSLLPVRGGLPEFDDGLLREWSPPRTRGFTGVNVLGVSARIGLLPVRGGLPIVKRAQEHGPAVSSPPVDHVGARGFSNPVLRKNRITHFTSPCPGVHSRFIHLLAYSYL
jgi:hypothetical protein